MSEDPANVPVASSDSPPAPRLDTGLIARIRVSWKWIRSHRSEALGTVGLIIALALVLVAGLIWTDQGRDLLQSADVWYRGLLLFSGLTISLVTLEGLIILLVKKSGESFDIDSHVRFGGFSALVMGAVAALHNNVLVGIAVVLIGLFGGVVIPSAFSGFLNHSPRSAANIVGGLAAIILLLVAWAPNIAGDWIGSAAVLNLIILAWVFVIFALAAAGYLSGKPGRGTWLLVLVAGSMWAVKSLVVLVLTWGRGYPILDYIRSDPSGQVARVQKLEDAFARWKETAEADKPKGPVDSDQKAVSGKTPAAGDNKSILVLVGAAGGGIRASFWTSLIMSRLASSVPKFKKELFASSGVSGGSLGLGVSYGLLASKDASCVDTSQKDPCVRKFHDGDFLSGVLGATVAGLPANTLLPIFPGRDDALETSWENRWKWTVGFNSASANAFAKPIGDLWGSDMVHPLLLLNATTATSGDRAVSADVETNWIKLRTPCRINLTQEINPLLSASIGASARFPFFSDWGWIKVSHATGCKQLEAVADGGFYDNYGAATLIDLISGLKAAGANFDNIHLVVIQITSDPLREMGCLFRNLDKDKTDPADDFCQPQVAKPTWWSKLVDGAANFSQSTAAEHAHPSVPIRQFASNVAFLLQNAAFGGSGPGIVDVAMQARAATGIDVAQELREVTCKLKGSYYHLGMTGAEEIPLGWALSQTSQDRLTAILDDEKKYRNKRLNRLIKELNGGNPQGQC